MKRSFADGPFLDRLARNTLLALEGAQGLEVRVHRGAIWLTQQDDRRDIVIGTGEAFRLDREGRAVIEALQDASVSFRARSEPDENL